MFRSRGQDSGFRVLGFRFRVLGIGFWILGFGFWGEEFGFGYRDLWFGSYLFWSNQKICSVTGYTMGNQFCGRVKNQKNIIYDR